MVFSWWAFRNNKYLSESPAFFLIEEICRFWRACHQFFFFLHVCVQLCTDNLEDQIKFNSSLSSGILGNHGFLVFVPCLMSLFSLISMLLLSLFFSIIRILSKYYFWELFRVGFYKTSHSLTAFSSSGRQWSSIIWNICVIYYTFLKYLSIKIILTCRDLLCTMLIPGIADHDPAQFPLLSSF